jgi:hypothetical protein
MLPFNPFAEISSLRYEMTVIHFYSEEGKFSGFTANHEQNIEL